MKTLRFMIVLISGWLFLSACQSQTLAPTTEVPPPAVETQVETQAPEPAEPTEAQSAGNVELALAGFQKGGCAACHVILGVPGAVGVIGPDLSAIGEVVQARLESGEYSGPAKSLHEYLLESITTPETFLAPDCAGKPCPIGLMPASLAQALSEPELQAMIAYLSKLPELEPTSEAEEPGEGGSEVSTVNLAEIELEETDFE